MSALKIGDYVIIADGTWKSTYGKVGKIESFHMPSIGVYNAMVRYLNEEPSKDEDCKPINRALVNVHALRQITEEEAFIMKLSEE